MPIGKSCEHCGKQFFVSPRRSDEVKFCSRECKTAAGRVMLTCECCGKTFEKKKSDVSRSKSFFCSTECVAKSRKGKPKASKAPKHYKTCEVCAKEFRVTLTRKDTARFCSRGCQSNSEAFRQECSEAQRGEKSWRWTGGRFTSYDGYILTRDASLGSMRLREHRLVMLKAMLEQAPGHPFLQEIGGKWLLHSDVDVHHIDRNRSNNELSNLLAVTKEAHDRIHNGNTKPNPWECWPMNPTQW